MKILKYIVPAVLVMLGFGACENMDDLYKDGYFDLIYSDRHGERVYCITLLNKGKAFFRGKKIFKRNLLFRVLVTLLLAVLSFITGLILKAIF